MNHRSQRPRKAINSWWWRLPLAFLMMALALGAFWFSMHLYTSGFRSFPAAVTPQVKPSKEPLAPNQRCMNGVRLERIPGGWRDVPESPC